MINLIKYSKFYFALSALFVIPSIVALLVWGLRPGIDFTGGSLLEVAIGAPNEEISEAQVSEVLNEYEQISSIQKSDADFIIRAQNVDAAVSQEIQSDLENAFGFVQEIRFERVGPTLGAELIRKTIFAVILASVSILAYMAYRFREIMYGVCGVLAMFHDTIIVAGSFAFLGQFFQVEVDTLFVTAILTTLSFSVHDTIVVYDRIRELLRLHPKAKFEDVVNNAILETLSRSINNSMTIIFMLLALVLLGGESIRWFVTALLIGTITGTYSSTFTAAPLLVLWDKHRRSA